MVNLKTDMTRETGIPITTVTSVNTTSSQMMCLGASRMLVVGEMKAIALHQRQQRWRAVPEPVGCCEIRLSLHYRCPLMHPVELRA